MTMEDKAKNALDQVSGKVKETIGEVTDDPKLELEGRLQGAKGVVGSKVEEFKDAVKVAVDDVKDAVDDAKNAREAKVAEEAVRP